MYLSEFLLLTTILSLGFLMKINAFSADEFNEIDFQRKSKLEFVHLLWRHGDRSPIRQNPGDPYDSSFWPDGWAQLTNLGKQQHYKLGKWLRRRYNGFLPSMYNSNDIYVQSSDVDRTLMSVQSNMAGLYPPKRNQIWNFLLQWQPIPVHTTPVTDDFLIAAQVPSSCLSYQKAYTEYQQSPAIQLKQQQAKPFFELVSVRMNATVNNFLTLLLVRDSWVCESAHNLPLPKWAIPLYRNNEEFYNAALTSYYFSTATPYLAKYASGFFLKDILDRMISKAAKTLVPDRKLWVYSSHDSTVFGFLNSLGVSDVFDNKFAGYTATIIVELRSYRSEYYVQLFYKNLDEEVVLINIPGCGTACPLSKMYEISDNIIPKNPFDVECQIYE